ncbi:phospho-sugar mutase [Alkalihalobacillus oceani]|uniref:phospho-sugar mutase n=1 Tax=Halalkalibacter oceani TaxID=1653776 RepID=UPI00203DA7E6|nr:phospho-sugar mutase [Halalkalibacter oceani]MCM3762149.1 phospho-sugar mutase [Halalkalibacter oceani]
MEWKEQYKRWSSYSGLEAEMSEALLQLADKEEELEDCFYKHLEFGTGGMRGELGPGPNRLNRYTVRRAAEGLARFLTAKGAVAKERGVVIAYDSRYQSKEFAMEAALTLGRHRIRTWLFAELRPTPELSFAVRYLEAEAGIMITASHNPPQYNGFKIYGPDGGQLPPGPAEALVRYVDAVENELEIAVADELDLKKERLLHMIGADVDTAYLGQVKSLLVQPGLVKEWGGQLRMVFTPLHGAANLPVQRTFAESGFSALTVVAEQELPDPEFPTVVSPNPEEEEAFALAMEYGKKEQAELLLATDPDGDRMGVAVRDVNGDYICLSGNQIGALLLDYLLSEKKRQQCLPTNGTVIKTIVTSEFGRAIAESYHMTTLDTLTGFKFIAEKIKEFEQTGEHTFLFGYEESYGYLIGDFARDKDAVQACLLTAELAAYYKAKQMSLYEGLYALYEKHGYFEEGLTSVTLKGKAGLKKMAELLNAFRHSPPDILAGKRVTTIEDYQAASALNTVTGETVILDYPRSNVLKYKLEDDSWFCVRPSGTEPKIKFYFGVKGTSEDDSRQRLKTLQDEVLERVEGFDGRVDE